MQSWAWLFPESSTSSLDTKFLGPSFSLEQSLKMEGGYRRGPLLFVNGLLVLEGTLVLSLVPAFLSVGTALCSLDFCYSQTF